jgi:hypothetical protein
MYTVFVEKDKESDNMISLENVVRIMLSLSYGYQFLFGQSDQIN